MIIYEEKKPKPKWPKKRTCKKCSSILGIEENDIKTYYIQDQKEGHYPIKGYKCPVCEEIQELGIFEY